MDFAQARDRMVDSQIARRGISEPRLLRAMREVPREAFVRPGDEGRAHADEPLPLAEGQTISQPYIVARMIAAAGVEAGDRVLEVGAGSGYAAAILGRLAAHVTSIERRPALARAARERLARLGYANVAIHDGDGTLGWPADAPFDVILVAAGAPSVPEALKAQLAPGGRLVIPVERQDGAHGTQDLRRLTRLADGFEETTLEPVRFVPLIGAQGWKETP
ncbi:protein-L-isoaspartate(D-aspartate) O-methyltransferase [Rubellimicrobium aerolatum]|uniref:Protein-L-isoaspartate O-methyltransferase n=1 Tax=Rubellimicrobium aerolatum TaxID=490979 RepID=A0ABW0S956_9RHOB|nr:protein-L-isoaspartate(D-aspartate) O-methyltransferase [Rubellimicrobium aerolatum]